MIHKNLLISLFFFISIFMLPLCLKASTISSYNLKPSFVISNDSLRIAELQQRVSEIEQMNLSNLSSSEKKELRHELKLMMKEAKTYQQSVGLPGIYLSAGAVIVIIIVLLLVLR